MANLDGRRFQDIYVVDLATGERTLAVKKSRWTYGAVADRHPLPATTKTATTTPTT